VLLFQQGFFGEPGKAAGFVRDIDGGFNIKYVCENKHTLY
jgi:hypothetical protein